MENSTAVGTGERSSSTASGVLEEPSSHGDAAWRRATIGAAGTAGLGMTLVVMEGSWWWAVARIAAVGIVVLGVIRLARGQPTSHHCGRAVGRPDRGRGGRRPRDLLYPGVRMEGPGRRWHARDSGRSRAPRRRCVVGAGVHVHVVVTGPRRAGRARRRLRPRVAGGDFASVSAGQDLGLLRRELLLSQDPSILDRRASCLSWSIPSGDVPAQDGGALETGSGLRFGCESAAWAGYFCS
jgi:hypothetical protein